MVAHFILKLSGIYFWMKLYAYIQRCSITPAGYSLLIPVISDIHAQIAWLSRNNYKLVNTLSNNNYKHIMRFLDYFLVEIAHAHAHFLLLIVHNTLWFLQNVNEVQPSWNDVFNFKWNFTHSNFINDERKENVHCLFWKK